MRITMKDTLFTILIHVQELLPPNNVGGGGGSSNHRSCSLPARWEEGEGPADIGAAPFQQGGRRWRLQQPQELLPPSKVGEGGGSGSHRSCSLPARWEDGEVQAATKAAPSQQSGRRWGLQQPPELLPPSKVGGGRLRQQQELLPPSKVGGGGGSGNHRSCSLPASWKEGEGPADIEAAPFH